jgi:hypothetical protein
VIIEPADKNRLRFPAPSTFFSPDDITEAEHLDELLDEVLRRFQQAIRLQSQSNETYAIDTIVRALDRCCPGW